MRACYSLFMQWQVEGMIYWFRRVGSVRDVGPWNKSSEEVSRYKTSPREKDRSLRISAGTKHHTEEIKSGVIGNYRRYQTSPRENSGP